MEPYSEAEIRKQALQRIQKKKEFYSHLITYGVINLLIVGIWAGTSRGFFWPMIPLLGWGIGLFFHAWETFGRAPTEERIQREMRRIRPRSPTHA